MNNPLCALCGHVNRDGAITCEACDARLDTSGWAGNSEPFDDASEPFDATGEPSWTAPDSSGSDDAWSPAAEIPSPLFKGARDVISPMLAVYRKHFTLVGILVLVAMLPQALLQYGIMDAMGVPVRRGVVHVHMGAANVLLWLLTMAGGALLSGSLVYAVVDLQRVGRASAGACLLRGLKVLPKVFLVTLLYSLVTSVGYILLIVPGIIFSLMYAVCVPVAIIEGRGPMDALNRSKELTSGYKGLLFITYFLWGLLVFVLNIVVTMSFANSGRLDLLPTLLLQTAVLGMLNSSLHVLTVYIYLGLLREHQSGFQAGAFTHGPEAAAR
ncbi:MAG: hypothetical protein ACJ74T_18400 [Pyrinomonadaceae bacterium]